MNRPDPPGQLYDIGGYRLHLQKQGQGRPAAVLDTGLGGNSLVWANALPAVARVTEACTFDRAGSGWSDPAPDGQRRTSQQMVEELRRLLKAAGLQPPYVLVGHSSGAIHTLVFAKRYPAEVAGLVLVEPSHPDMFKRAAQVPGARPMSLMYGGLAGLRRLGLLRWVGPAFLRAVIPNGARTLPAAAWNSLQYFAAQGQDYRSASREAAVADESFTDAHCEPGGLGALPLVVLTAEWWVSGKPNSMKKTFYPLRQEMAAFSTAGWHEIVSGTDHTNLPIVRPEAVAQAVKAVIELSTATPRAI
ncbi:MAG: alpha/beta hydrolase [Anaerolineales bacterium]